MKTSTLLDLLEQYKVVIPPIQRDYAQGRTIGKIPHIRKRFIQDLEAVLSNNTLSPLELDFIYGYEERDKTLQSEIMVFKPLDGQQRLTTLFLLHWYVAVQEEDYLTTVKDLLSNFSYATRKSSRDFCEKLIHFIPKKNGLPIERQITNEPWFFSSWKSDPTIKSMLVVLEAIENSFKGKEHLWDKLKGPSPRIIFHLLPMDDLGLPDDLYIKMNARGKGLTDFEHFKSRFSEILDEKNAQYFNDKIDKDWSDLFWNIFRDTKSKDIAQEVDNGFLSFFWYITDILIKRNKLKINTEFWLDRIKEVYSGKPNYVDFLFRSLELFERFESGKTLETENTLYFDDFLYVDPEDFDASKTRIFFNNAQVNLFRKCARTYGFESKKNGFSVGEQLMLYAFIHMKLNDCFNFKIFRFLRNIFASSEDQIRNEYLESFLYKDIELIANDMTAVLENNEFSEGSKLSKRQCREERDKLHLIAKNPLLEETIYKLEDHQLLRGNIALFNFDDSINQYARQFFMNFDANCDYLSISKALLTIGDYGQSYGKLKRYGNKTNSTWRELFTQSENRKGFDNTKTIVNDYLKQFIDDQNQTNDKLIHQFLQSFQTNEMLPKKFNYYKVKYDSFTLWNQNQTNGFYYWDDRDNCPYEYWMLFRQQFNGRHWNPFLLTINSSNEQCSLENKGDKLHYIKDRIILLIENLNSGFKINSTDDSSQEFLNKLISNEILNNNGILEIRQDENGFDLEDRIVKCNEFLVTLNALEL